MYCCWPLLWITCSLNIHYTNHPDTASYLPTCLSPFFFLNTTWHFLWEFNMRSNMTIGHKSYLVSVDVLDFCNWHRQEQWCVSLMCSFIATCVFPVIKGKPGWGIRTNLCKGKDKDGEGARGRGHYVPAILFALMRMLLAWVVHLSKLPALLSIWWCVFPCRVAAANVICSFRKDSWL